MWVSVTLLSHLLVLYSVTSGYHSILLSVTVSILKCLCGWKKLICQAQTVTLCNWAVLVSLVGSAALTASCILIRIDLKAGELKTNNTSDLKRWENCPLTERDNRSDRHLHYSSYQVMLPFHWYLMRFINYAPWSNLEGLCIFGTEVKWTRESTVDCAGGKKTGKPVCKMLNHYNLEEACKPSHNLTLCLTLQMASWQNGRVLSPLWDL